MDNLLIKIKDRISEKNSPVRTVKGVAEAIGMSEAGFYRMVQRDAPKYATVVALAKALQVDESYFTGETVQKASPENFKYGDDVLAQIMQDMHEMRQMFEEQLRAKDAQIAGLLKTVDALVGKYEGDNLDQLLTATDEGEINYQRYVATTLKNNVLPSLRTIFLSRPVTK